jgi:hypothetical protein
MFGVFLSALLANMALKLNTLDNVEEFPWLKRQYNFMLKIVCQEQILPSQTVL